MARDNSPKIRQIRQLERKQGRRASYDRILIVSEGSKTEPNYFDEIRSTLRLHTANVVVRPSELGTAPIQVVQYAKQLFLDGDRHRNIQRLAFEKVFAVFDRDDHKSYSNALKAAESLDGKLNNDNKQLIQFHAVPSIPSFELWLLLHFENVQSQIDRHEVFRRLKKHIPQYEKGCKGTFRMTREHLGSAFSRAEKLGQYNSAYSHPEPYTAVGNLVQLLTSLRT
jgi:hypothetical protein